MAKRKNAETEVEHVEATVEIIETAEAALAPYLDGKPYNAERLLDEVEFYYRQHTESAFEVGKRLIALKQFSDHGTFTTNVLERVRISRQHAHHLMAFARTVVEIAATSKGQLDFNKLQAMDTRKVVLLGELAEDSAEELEETGKIGGRTLDEWDAKSRNELKAEVKRLLGKVEEGREQLQRTTDKLIRERDKVDALLSATPNAVTESVTRLGQSLRDSLESFEATAHTDAELEPDSAAILDLVGLRAALRTYFERVNHIIEERFPAVLEAEVPTDLDLTAPAPVGTAKIIDPK